MIQSKFVTIVTVTDPDSGLPVEVEIRKLESGAMIGIDGSFLEQMADEDVIFSPYDSGNAAFVQHDGKIVPINVPFDEK